MHRLNIRAILANPAKRRALMVRTIIATQAREGIATTLEQAEAAYDKVLKEKETQCTVSSPRTRNA